MKKINKGFTLIELLAVILILGIIAIIAIPTVNKILDESRRGAFENTLNNIDKKVKESCTMNAIKDEKITRHYYINNGKVTPNLDLKGDLPDGDIFVDNNCNITYFLENKNYTGDKEDSEDRPLINKNDGSRLKTLIGTIKKNNEILKNPLSKPGIEEILFNEDNLIENEDDDGITYYFRGNVENNYVKLGVYPNTIWYNSSNKYYDTEAACGDGCSTILEGTPMIFRIVRINGDASIRLISEKPINTLRFNSVNYLDTETRETSIKLKLDNWLSLFEQKNVGTNNIISKTSFCNDNSIPSSSYPIGYGYYYRKLDPSFKCPTISNNNGGKLELSIGLLSADEAVFAGAKYSSSVSSSYFLANGTESWTMTPIFKVDGGKVVKFYDKIKDFYIIDYGNDGSGVRPVLNLKHSTKIKGGTGTISDPYEINF